MTDAQMAAAIMILAAATIELIANKQQTKNMDIPASLIILFALSFWLIVWLAYLSPGTGVAIAALLLIAVIFNHKTLVITSLTLVNQWLQDLNSIQNKG